MTNQKQKYYCAWHPEKGKHLPLFEDRVVCGNMIWNEYPDKPTKFNCEGWIIKEVYIVDADFLTELKNYMINNEMELPNILRDD